MIGHHVAQRASLLVKFSAMLDTDRLCSGDLKVINMFSIPHWLEETVGKAESHNVLDRFLAKKVIDPINLILLQMLENLPVERFSRSQVVAERFFNNDTPPLVVCFSH